MHVWARAAVTSAVTIWVAVIVTGAASIYGFGQYELAWGRGASLQVYLWIATATALISCFGAGIGFRAGAVGGAVPRLLGAVAAGLVALALSTATIALVPDQTEVAFLYVGASFFVVTAVVAYIACKLAGKGTARAV
jgi:hypothetical protein